MAGGISKVVYTWYRRDIEERVYCKKKIKIMWLCPWW